MGMQVNVEVMDLVNNGIAFTFTKHSYGSGSEAEYHYTINIHDINFGMDVIGKTAISDVNKYGTNKDIIIAFLLERGVPFQIA